MFSFFINCHVWKTISWTIVIFSFKMRYNDRRLGCAMITRDQGVAA